MATYLNRDLLVRLDEQDDIGPIEGYTFKGYDVSELARDEEAGDIVMFFTGPGEVLFSVPMTLTIEDQDGEWHELFPGDERVWTVHHIEEEEGERMVEVFPVR